MWFWIYFIMIMLAALFSQLAQFAHLKHAGTWSMGTAFLFALSMACIEYVFNVPANRVGLEKVGLTVNQLQIIYVAGMLFFYTLLSKYYFKTRFTWVNALALLMMGGAAAITFLV